MAEALGSVSASQLRAEPAEWAGTTPLPVKPVSAEKVAELERVRIHLEDALRRAQRDNDQLHDDSATIAQGEPVTAELDAFPATLLTAEQEIRARAADAASGFAHLWTADYDNHTELAADVLTLVEHMARYITNGTQPDEPDMAHKAELEAVLLRLVDGETDPCDLDHHGYCQAHALHSPPCPIPVARKLLGLDDEVPS